MDRLQEEINRRKKQNALYSTASSTLSLDGVAVVAESSEKNVSATAKPTASKYIRRGEVLEKQREEYWRKRGVDIREIDEGVNGNGSKKQRKAEDDEGVKAINLPRKEVIRRLRQRKEPILLFGETDEDALARLKRLEILAPEINLGMRNDLMAAMDRVDQELLNEMAKGEKSNSNDAQKRKESQEKHAQQSRDSETTLEELCMYAAQQLDNKGDDKKNCVIVLDWINLMLNLWSNKLHARPAEERTSEKGKKERAIHSQTEEYLRPLMTMLSNGSIPFDILHNLSDIMVHLLHFDYVKANHAYLEMAIGNSPWPIGVTMVGIHARPGREKVFSKEIAHVLNDETQRKYIQAFKRLISRMQEFYPQNPSKCVKS